MGKQQYKDFQEGVFVINEDYHIVYMDEGIKYNFPLCRMGEQCFSSLRMQHTPCRDCPIHLNHLIRTQTTSNFMLYYPELKRWLIYNMIHVQWPKEGNCVLISLKSVLNAQHIVNLKMNKEANYEEAFELNLKKHTYTSLYLEEDNKIATEGNLDNFIQTICYKSIHPHDQKEFMDFFYLATMNQRLEHMGFINKEFRVLYNKDEYRWMSFYITPVTKLLEQQMCLLFVIDAERQYVVEQTTAENALYQMLDPLTGLYNASTFHKMVRERLKEEKDQSYGIVNIDIEHFKLFNDWYGTEEGDKLLIYIAEKIKSKTGTCRGIGARFGGDDFMMLLPEKYCNVKVIEKEIFAWMQGYASDVKFLPTGGIYIIEDHDISVTLMCDRATLALNSVKGNYATRVAFYNGTMKQKLENEQEILFEVKHGLENEEFEVYYQPQCNARTNKIIGAEALVRWNHPQKGMLAPLSFIPILESSGFISKLDYYVWEHVCKLLHERIKANLEVVPISVNVSRMDIYQYHITEVFLELIKKYELPANILEIEITESAYTENYDSLIESVTELRKAGFIVLMDDFGSGYSSLNMLKDMEVDVLKIDMKFLEMNEISEMKGSGILESIVQMGKWLGLRLIAEGVETQKQIENLLSLDCEYVQGYYYYKPMSTKDFISLLNQKDKIDTRGILAKKLPTIQLDDLFHKDITSEAMLNNLLGGIALYELIDGDKLEIRMVNNTYYHITGCNSVDLNERKENILKQIHPDDVPMVMEIFHNAEKSPMLGASGVFRRYRLNGELMWMHMRLFFLRTQGNSKLFYGAISDYSEMVNLKNGMLRLLDTIPGDVLEFKVKDNKIVSRHVVCAGLAAQHGYDKAEYRELIAVDGSHTLIYEEDRKRVMDIMTNPMKWAEHEGIEFRDVAKDGSILWLEISVHYAGSEEGVDIYDTLCTDVTAIKKQEKELLDSQNVLQSILGISNAKGSKVSLAMKNKEYAAYLFANSMSGGIIAGYCDEGFTLYFANDEIISLLGFDSYQDFYDGINGKLMNTIYIEDRNRVKRDIGDNFYEGYEYTVNYRMVRKNNSLLWVINRGRVIKAENDQLAVISYCIDISEKMNTQMELRKAQEDINLLNSLVPGGYHQCYDKPDFPIKHVSDRFLDMIGYTKEELELNFDNKYINLIYPADRELMRETVRYSRGNQGLFTGEYRLYTANGIIWVRDQTRIIIEDNECFFAGIIEDITDIINMKQKLETIVANTPGDVFCIENNEIYFYSFNLSKTMGYSHEEYKQQIIETKGTCFTDPRDKKMVHEAIFNARKTKQDIDLMFRSITKNKETRYIHMIAMNRGLYEGDLLYYGIMMDATALINKEQELNITQQMYESIIHQANLSVWEYEAKRDILTINEDGLKQICTMNPNNAVKNYNNYILSDFLKRDYNRYSGCKSLELLKNKILKHKFNEEIIEVMLFSNLHRWVKLTCEPIFDENGELIKVIGYLQNISKQVEKETLAKEEKKYAQFDSLTGIYNRRMGELMMRNALALCSSKQKYALMMIDLDDFKQINDQYGHLQGDRVLREIASVIMTHMGNGDIFCRYGGDEFLVLMKYQQLDAIKQKINAIQNSLAKCCTLQGNENVYISIGVATAPMHGMNLQVLYEKADKALYRAKLNGKNQYYIYAE